MKRAVPAFALLMIALAALTQFAAADGILVPPLRPDAPYFTIKYHHVEVTVEDQVATTHVDQVFVNETDREQEATYIFPLPVGAVVKDFAVIADGKRMEGEMLARDKAVAIYEEIVRKRKDPALLEYVGRDMYKARIFPIPGHGERRIEIIYTQVLPYDNGMIAYNYPLSTEKFSNQPVKETVFTCKIKSTATLGAVYSPSHEIEVARKGKHAVTVSYEETKTKPDRDMLLYYTVSKEEVGTSVLTFKEKGEDGFFLMLAAPSADDAEKKPAPKNVVFVLDRSGSMSGEKIEQARKALEFCVNSLNEEDRFEIITFATEVSRFGDGLVPANKEQIAKARKFIKEIKPAGGTDIDGALKEALDTRKAGVPNYIAFMTDGLPTAGAERDPAQIIKRVAKRVDDMEKTPTRLFSFGVGYDVDTHFLDKLSDDNGGLSTYVRPSEDIEVKVSNWYAKISQPVLTDVSVDFGDAKTFDSYPRELPDLFAGSQVTLLGRYKDESAGKTTVTLKGDTGHGKRSFASDVELPRVREGTDYVASLWASRKIGYLLDQIRIHGKDKELVDEIVALSLKYGILTEYTAFLAQEDRPMALSAAADRAREVMAAPGMGGMGMSMGGGAVAQSQNAQAMRGAAKVSSQNHWVDSEGKDQQLSNVRNVTQRGFVQRGEQWQDMRYTGQNQQVDLQIKAYSKAYFQISHAIPASNQFLALSDNMILMLNGKAVQIGTEGKDELTEEELRGLGAG